VRGRSGLCCRRIRLGWGRGKAVVGSRSDSPSVTLRGSPSPIHSEFSASFSLSLCLCVGLNQACEGLYGLNIQRRPGRPRAAHNWWDCNVGYGGRGGVGAPVSTQLRPVFSACIQYTEGAGVALLERASYTAGRMDTGQQDGM
jgi:hypothetical protein